MLTHWGRVTYICVSKLNTNASDNGLPPDRRQAIIWTNAGILLIEPLRKNFSEISIEIHTFSFKEMHLKMLSGKWQPFCLGLNVLTGHVTQVAIVGTVLLDKSLQLIGRLGTRRFHLPVPHLQMSCRLDNLTGYHLTSSSNGHKVTSPIDWLSLLFILTPKNPYSIFFLIKVLYQIEVPPCHILPYCP